MGASIFHPRDGHRATLLSGPRSGGPATDAGPVSVRPDRRASRRPRPAPESKPSGLPVRSRWPLRSAPFPPNGEDMGLLSARSRRDRLTLSPPLASQALSVRQARGEPLPGGSPFGTLFSGKGPTQTRRSRDSRGGVVSPGRWPAALQSDSAGPQRKNWPLGKNTRSQPHIAELLGRRAGTRPEGVQPEH
jgi:hypothetical protein